MIKKHVLLMATALLFVSPAWSQEPMSPNYEHLKEYGEATAGRWAGEIESDFEFPPLLKKGDKIKIIVDNEWILNKNAMSSKWTAEIDGVSVASGAALVGWDKSAERIVSSGFGTLGGRWNGVIEKRGEKWHSSGMGVGPDGKIGAGTEIISFKDEKTHEILQIGRLSPQGEPLPDQTVTYTRIE